MATYIKVKNTFIFACCYAEYWKGIEGIDHEFSRDREHILS